MDKEYYKEFADFLRTLDPDEVERKNMAQVERDQVDFLDFKKKLGKGICKYCKKSINHFNAESPCFHWLLKPQGIKTKQLLTILEKYGYYRSSNYLRWAATTEDFLKNINEYSESEADVVFHQTIRYKSLEWTFLCKTSDFEGHSGKVNFPHFHVQLLVNAKVNIAFNSNHVRLTQEDHWVICMSRDHSDVFEILPSIAPSAKTLFEKLPPRQIISGLETPETGEGNIRIQTMLRAKAGQTLSGDTLAAMMTEANSKGIPIAALVERYFPDANISQTLSPSDDTPENYERV